MDVITERHSASLPVVLAIGGHDPSGGAGLPADARAIAAFGGHCCGITTAVIAQNTQGVQEFERVSPELLDAQLVNLLDDITPQAVKIGMLPDAVAVKVVAKHLVALQQRVERQVPVIFDTVFAPSQGPIFSTESTIEAIQELLLPLCEWITPNVPEASQLLQSELRDDNALARACRELHRRFQTPYVLLKGGHRPPPDTIEQAGQEPQAIDLLFDGTNQLLTELRAPRIMGYEVRGTGCLLASAIASQRASGEDAFEAARRAKLWLHEKIKTAHQIGHGRRIAV